MSLAPAPRRPDPAAAAIETNLAIEDARWERALPNLEALLRDALAALAARLDLAGAPTELGVTLADDAAVRALNAEWRGKDRPTNVLSFPARALAPGERPGLLLGDLVLAFETCEREAATEEKRFGDHVAHLVVHGTLHCLGHDHADDAAADAMEALEILILGDLGIADPYGADGGAETATDTEPQRA